MKRKSWLKYTLLNNVRSQIKLNSFCRKWEKMNPENDTIPKNCFPIENVKVGKYTYGELNVITFSNNTKLNIGNYVSIAQDVVFLLDVEHFIDHISTYPFRVKVVQDCECEAISKGDIIVEDDVWIGYGAKIMSGVRIGQGSVIAAAAVVTRDVPPYTIVGGIPAKVIKQRFDSDICEKLSNTDFSRIRDKDIKNNLTELYTTVSINNVEYLLANLPTKL